MLRKIHGRKITLIFQGFLSFILFVACSGAMAFKAQNASFLDVMRGIKNEELYNVSYNTPKTKAIVSLNDGSAVYVDFETQKTLKLMEGWINNFIGTWLTDTVAVV